jgi:hypothetical protein
MERQKILDRYRWRTGVCFRHPASGDVATAAIAVLCPRGGERHEVRACAECVIALEDMKREYGSRSGDNCPPDADAVCPAPDPSQRREAGENLGSDSGRGAAGENQESHSAPHNATRNH